ncbi:MAG: rhodanese-like domain-containing protein [Gemmatimonadota bacterium]|nr:rhodanese-like domain-containing protein [Gemmatimonadota bacterium]
MKALICVVLVATVPLSGQDSFGGQKPPSPPPAAAPAPRPAAPAGAAELDAQMAAERQDFGVAATSRLHAGAMHGPTPTSIPGGQVITTRGLVELLKGEQVRALVFDILGGQEMLPGATLAVPAAQAGSFTDRTQQEFGQFLQQMTQGNKETPLVFYCLSTHCWMSYNASLRAINMGYRNVLWYRGGIEAWKAAGQAVVPAGGGGR